MNNTIKLDLREELPDYASRRTVQVREGERGIVLKFQIFEFGKPFDLTGYETRLKATLPDGYEVVDLVDVADAENGCVTYTTPLELASCPGVFWPYLEVRTPDSTYIDATRPFRMQCTNGTSVTVDENYVPELYKFISDGQIAIASCNEATTNAVEATLAVTAASDAAFEALDSAEAALEASTAAAQNANAAAGNADTATASANAASARANASAAAADASKASADAATASANAAAQSAGNAATSANGAASNAVAAGSQALAIANAIANGSAGDEEVAQMRGQIDQLGHLLAESTGGFVAVGTTVFAPAAKATAAGTVVSLPTSTASNTTITLN